MKIRKGKIEYAEEICNLVRSSITELCVLDHNNDREQLSDWLENKTVENVELWVENNLSFCAFNQNCGMVGFTLINIKNEILLNYVSPARYRSGVGKELLKKIEASVTKPCVLSVRPTQTALGFYRHMEFIASPNDPQILIKVLEQ